MSSSAEFSQAQASPFATPVAPAPAAPGFSAPPSPGRGFPMAEPQAQGPLVVPGNQPGMPPQPVALSYPIPPAGPEPSPTRVIWLVAVILEVVIILGLLLGVIALSSRNAELEYELNGIQLSAEELQREVDKLQ